MLKFRHFLKELLKVTFVLLAVIAALSFFDFFKDYLLITWVSLAFFCLMTIFSGYYNSRSIAKPFFINIFMGTLAIKFMASLMFIGIFYYAYQYAYGIVPNKFLVIPFLLVFLVYKVFETAILLKYSREASRQNK